VGNHKPEICVASSEDGLGLVLVITNPSPVPVTIIEPHPHTSVQLYDAKGQPWPMHHGVFAAISRWQVTVPPGEVRQRVVVLPRFFLDAQGEFGAVCTVRYRAGDQTEQLTVRGPVQLALPTVEEFYSDSGAAQRMRLECYERAGFVYPLPDTDRNKSRSLRTV
jgi:hypothetical protein